jgi:hypothetical protein
VEVGASLGRPTLDLLGIRLDDASAGDPDRVQGSRYGGAGHPGAAIRAVRDVTTLGLAVAVGGVPGADAFRGSAEEDMRRGVIGYLLGCI